MPLGVDEAGKGPAIGAMFAAAVRVDDRSRLPEGIADSKDLSPSRREELAARLRDAAGIAVGVRSVPPARIDAPDTDMNGLAVEAHAGAIEAALEDVPADALPAEPRVRCDACDTDAERFARRVADACAVAVRVDARHGADADDPLVGAASVIAKVARDDHVAELAAEYGDLGSGYPSDPTTRAFLESYVAANGDVPPCARRSWSTCRDVLAAAAQTTLGDVADE